jgi:hypothetical protein
MHALRILLLVITVGVLAFLLYQAITRQIPRDSFWTVIAIACGFSLNLIYLWFSTMGGPPVAIEDKPPVAVEEKAPVVDKANDDGPVVIDDKPPVAVKEKAPVVDKANDDGPVVIDDKPPVAVKENDAGPPPDEISGKGRLTPNCEKELRRTADLLRFFVNRIQTGEEMQSVVADVRQQEKRIAAVCPD